MAKLLDTALRLAIVTLLVTGLAYPLAVTGLAQLMFAHRANGSLIHGGDGCVNGSELIGQSFGSARYFWPRPSAAGDGYDGASSGGSNLGPTSAALRERTAREISRLRGENPDAPPLVPADLVTASGSGLDPDISPEAALWQVPRVASARHADPDRIRVIVGAHVEPRSLGFLGEPRVNVLLLNLALDRQLAR